MVEVFNIFGQKKQRKLTAADKKRIAAKQGWKCKKCKRMLPVVYHIDHIKEHSKGGSDRESNLQALCPICHAEKHEENRNKDRQQKIRSSERGERKIQNNPFSVGKVLGKQSKGGILGKGDLFGSGDIFGQKKKKKGRDSGLSW